MTATNGVKRVMATVVDGKPFIWPEGNVRDYIEAILPDFVILPDGAAERVSTDLDDRLREAVGFFCIEFGYQLEE